MNFDSPFPCSLSYRASSLDRLSKLGILPRLLSPPSHPRHRPREQAVLHWTRLPTACLFEISTSLIYVFSAERMKSFVHTHPTIAFFQSDRVLSYSSHAWINCSSRAQLRSTRYVADRLSLTTKYRGKGARRSSRVWTISWCKRKRGFAAWRSILEMCLKTAHRSLSSLPAIQSVELRSSSRARVSPLGHTVNRFGGAGALHDGLAPLQALEDGGLQRRSFSWLGPWQH